MSGSLKTPLPFAMMMAVQFILLHKKQVISGWVREVLGVERRKDGEETGATLLNNLNLTSITPASNFFRGKNDIRIVTIIEA